MDQVEIPTGVVDGIGCGLRRIPMYYRASEQKGTLPFADASKSVVSPIELPAIAGHAIIESRTTWDASYTPYLRHRLERRTGVASARIFCSKQDALNRRVFLPDRKQPYPEMKANNPIRL